MKQTVIVLSIVAAALTARADLPAFPGAEGFGAYAAGGRGGDVYHVTNLSDSGPGSLRQGITTASGPRTIVFDLSGTIVLQSILRIDRPNITIAGQTAPGDGICIRDCSINIKNTHDIIVRCLRIRRGDVQVRASGRPTSSDGLDAVSINDSRNVIFDHVSLSWSCDEIFGIVQNQNVTIQWCIISEPLADPLLHPYGHQHAHGLNDSANTLSIHHCLVANYVMRGPQFEANDALSSQGYNVYMEAVDNVLFDYKQSGSRYTTGIQSNPPAAAGIAFRFHFVNNMYIRSPSRTAARDIEAATRWGVTDQLKVYVSGNIGPNRPTDDMNQWALVSLSDGTNIRNAASDVQAQMSDVPLFVSSVPITTQTAQQAYDLVISHAGCSCKRDAVDLRIINNVNQKNFMDYLRSQEQVGGWPALNTYNVLMDTDGDAMPDIWETAHALDPNNPDDRNGDRDRDGYTNLEEYLNELCCPVNRDSD
ncbi:MAG TPA: hypothetical protein VMX13_17970 [Sedimentisphaerales bacterium]|nr:hypothetical protein [Sedimentisphaerales bacterium]